jgi:hypothetical protein
LKVLLLSRARFDHQPPSTLGILTMNQVSVSPTIFSALHDVRKFFDTVDPYSYDPQDVEALQLEAIRALFDKRRSQVRILDQRAKEVGTESIGTPDDLVPLLFADQTYKSYPETFIKNNQWAMMNRWLDTLSTERVGVDVDVSDVTDSDAWAQRLAEHGHRIVVSGGTSGKNSFLNRTLGDVRVAGESIVNNMALTLGLTRGAKDRPVILVSPSSGSYVFIDLLKSVAKAYGRPDAIYWLSEMPLTGAYTQRQGELRRKQKDGTATPGELLELQEHARERQEHMRGAIGNLADALIRHKDEPIILMGLWMPLWLLMEEARARGLSDGELHPDTAISSGGGLKGANLPPDFKEQLARFFGVGPERYYGNFGMVEMLTGFLECSEHRYHCPPWVKMLILDESGETLLEPVDGQVEGRLAFLDMLVEGRWGGVVTGDKVTVDYNPCTCGRKSPTITSVMRYADLVDGDDKLSCAGTMASYIRGEIT